MVIACSGGSQPQPLPLRFNRDPPGRLVDDVGPVQVVGLDSRSVLKVKLPPQQVQRTTKQALKKTNSAPQRKTKKDERSTISKKKQKVKQVRGIFGSKNGKFVCS